MSTHYKGSVKERLVLDTWIKFSRAKDTLDTIIRRDVEEQGLTISQFGVLEILLHLGPLCVGEIGTKLLMTSSNLVTVIDNLVKQTMVEKKPSEADRRSVIIHLTPKGRDMIQPIFHNHLNVLLECFSVLKNEQLKSLGSLSRELGLNQSHKKELL